MKYFVFGKWEGDDFLDNIEFLNFMMEYFEGEWNVVSVMEVENEMEGYEDKYVIFFEGM